MWYRIQDFKDSVLAYIINLIKFYFFVGLYSIKYVGLHFYNLVLHPKRYTQTKVSVPPPCLSNEINGQHQYVKLQKHKFHYVEKGDRTNRLVLLIHGYPEFWYSWRFQLQKLSSYYHVVAIDMKGYGDSDKPLSRNEYNIDVVTQELRDFLTAIGSQKCTLITHGQGGILGWNFISKYPDLVDNYISISSPHPTSFLQELELNRVPQTGWHYFCQLPYVPEKEVMKQDMAIFDTIFSRMLNNKRGNMTQEDLEAFKYTFSRKEDWVGPLNYIRALLKPQMYLGHTRKVRVPTLFIVGNADPFISLEMICKSSEYVDNFTLKIVEGGGHFLPQEMPNYINSIILDFLKLPEVQLPTREFPTDQSIIKKMFGAGRTVVTSTVNYGNQVILARRQ
ncbi:unnamed protein product [Allacma fusca]|uniref:AB hydrolase-1 domain-containing protein n=1 Tax=Allacma fusca TaxID=39272 RepID=A0A8J2NZ23_9HEXA|nr:unnamed protein product [Allacma fusca]